MVLIVISILLMFSGLLEKSPRTGWDGIGGSLRTNEVLGMGPKPKLLKKRSEPMDPSSLAKGISRA
jgi:hypothetical protein